MATALEEPEPVTLDERNRLIESCLPIVTHLAKRFDGRGVPFDELESVGHLALVRYAAGYESLRGKFSTGAFTAVRNAMLSALRSMRASEAEDFAEPESTLPLPDLSAESWEAHGRLAEAVACLPSIQWRVVVLRYGLNVTVEHTQRQTAAFLGISVSTVRRIEQEAIAQLRIRLESGE